MELSNRELKNILRENQVKNYSKLNKKELVKKVNQLTREQNGGKSGKKKYKLKELIGGKDPEELEQPLSNENRIIKNNPNSNSGKSRGNIPPSQAENSENKNKVSLANHLIESNTSQVSTDNTLTQPITSQKQVSTPNTLSQSKNNENKCNSCSIQ
jgi:hypothetical protein